MLDDRPYTLLSQFTEHPGRGGGEFYHRPGGGGLSVRYAYPPSGGLPAATFNVTTEELTPSRVMCRVARKDTTTGKVVPTNEMIEVENQVTSAVGASGKPMTIAFNETTKVWEVIVEDCTVSTSGGGFGLLSFVDPISQGTSSQLGMGYGYEGV